MLVLGNKQVEIGRPKANLEKEYGSFTEGHVNNQTSPNSFYIVYDKADYGKSEGSVTKAKLIPPDPLKDPAMSGNISFGFTVRSAQGFDLADPMIILFEHPKYIGNSEHHSTSQRKIDIPAKPWVGVNSIIITGGKWELFEKENFHQPRIVVNGQTVLGPGYYDLDVGDKLKSVKLVEL